VKNKHPFPFVAFGDDFLNKFFWQPVWLHQTMTRNTSRQATEKLNKNYKTGK
jgi:hypothetical protein